MRQYYQQQNLWKLYVFMIKSKKVAKFSGAAFGEFKKAWLTSTGYFIRNCK